MELEIEVNANTKGMVRTVVVIGLVNIRSNLRCDVTAIVESTHIAEVDVEALRSVNTYTTAKHVVREVERKVVHELVFQAITGIFP